MSDLHLDAVPCPEAFQPARPAFDGLVAAGDVWGGSSARALAVVANLAGGKPAAARRAADRHGVVLLDDDKALLVHQSLTRAGSNIFILCWAGLTRPLGASATEMPWSVTVDMQDNAGNTIGIAPRATAAS